MTDRTCGVPPQKSSRRQRFARPIQCPQVVVVRLLRCVRERNSRLPILLNAVRIVPNPADSGRNSIPSFSPHSTTAVTRRRPTISTTAAQRGARCHSGALEHLGGQRGYLCELTRPQAVSSSGRPVGFAAGMKSRPRPYALAPHLAFSLRSRGAPSRAIKRLGQPEHAPPITHHSLLALIRC